MSNTENYEQNDGLSLDDPDRLPWLETADGYEYDDGASPAKIAMMVLGGVLLLGAIVLGIYYIQSNQDATNSDGKGDVIAAEEGDYKVRPDDAGGKNFDGEGDAAYKAADGKKSTSSVSKADPKEDKSVTTNAAAATSTGPIAAGASFVQLGAFGDQANAKDTWDKLSKRFGFLSSVKYRVAEGSADGGRKVFRLQAAAANASEAQQLCAKLKAGGENCLIIK